MDKKTITFLDDIEVGDLLYYCPVDIKEEAHDIGIIYDICINENYENDKIKKYFIFWSRTSMHDMYSSNTLKRKLSSLRKGKYIMKIIKHGKKQKSSSL